ncbi:MAG: transposase, partial [bacterium]|nr:transposase [bacterium]
MQRLIADTHGIDISLGAISNIERRMTNGLQGAHAEAMAPVATSPTKHLDETTWRESGVLAWAWVAVGEAATAFLIRNSRQATVAHELVGDKPTGVVISDR